MYVSPRRFAANLDQPPVIRWAGVSEHGRVRRVEHYSVLGFWCIHLYRYRARLRIDDEWFDIRPGRASILPPDANLEYRYEGPSRHAAMHFRLPDGPAEASLPAMQDLGSAAGELAAALEQAIVWHPTRPQRAAARLWEILWRLADAGAMGQPIRGEAHPVVRRAVELIELRLAEPLYVPKLAAALDVSHNHLTRLFRRDLGLTVVDYIRRRRAERARHLLVGTTLPMKVIAAQVGLPDAHLFNKTIRRELGASPTEVRTGAPQR